MGGDESDRNVYPHASRLIGGETCRVRDATQSSGVIDTIRMTSRYTAPMNSPFPRRGVLISLLALLLVGCSAPAPTPSNDSDRRRENDEKRQWLNEMLDKGQHS